LLQQASIAVDSIEQQHNEALEKIEILEKERENERVSWSQRIETMQKVKTINNQFPSKVSHC
jgi:hypothetical protein